MTTEPRSLRDRVGGLTPEAAKAAEKAKRREYVFESFYPKTRGPKHFRGKIIEITGPHRGNATFQGEYSEWDYMRVHLDPDTLSIYDDNSNNPGATFFDVRLPEEGKDAQPNSEIVLTVEAARKVDGYRNMKDYFELEGKVVEMTSDFLETPPRRGEQYGLNIWYYAPTFIGGDNGLDTSSGSSPVIAEPDPVQVAKLAHWLVGQEASKVKRLDILKATSKQQLDTPDQALQGLIHNDMFVEYASAQGLIVLGEDGVYADPSA